MSGNDAALTERENRAASALLVIDMQRAVVANAHEVDRVAANISTLIDRAREQGAPVVWIYHDDADLEKGSEGWQYIDALDVADGEIIINKNYGDSFAETNLEAVLAEHQVGRVVVTGAQTDACIRSTLHSALVRGYAVTLAGDAHTGEDMRAYGSPMTPEQSIEYTNLYWNFSSAPGRRGETLATADITFATAD